MQNPKQEDQIRLKKTQGTGVTTGEIFDSPGAAYVPWLREKIGHQKTLLVFAGAIITNEHGEILWQKREDFETWGLPGGALELNETLSDCICREVLEETGLVVEPVKVVGAYTTPDFDVAYPNGDLAQQVTICFACRKTGGKMNERGEETLDLCWRSPKDLPDTFPWYQAMVADFARDEAYACFRHGSPGTSGSPTPFHVQMRRDIGHAPLILPAAGALVMDEKERILLLKRSDTGLWALPGGAMELGERIDQTIKREVKEETGITVEPRRLIGVFANLKNQFTYFNGDKLKVISFFFLSRLIRGTIDPDGTEALEAAFFTLEEIQSLEMMPYDAWMLETGLAEHPGTIYE